MKMQRIIYFAFLTSLIACSPVIVTAGHTETNKKQVTVLGFIENHQSDQARLVFAGSNGKWEPICNKGKPSGECLEIRPKGNTWSVLYKGLKINQFIGAEIGSSWEEENQIKLLSPERKLELVSPRPNIQGWNGKLESQPLLVVNEEKAVQKEAWTKTKAPKEILDAAKTEFIERIDSVEKCSEHGKPLGRMNVEDKDIDILQPIKLGRKYLFGLALKQTMYSCEGPAPVPWSSNWYLAVKDDVKLIVFSDEALGNIEKTSFALQFLDAADVDQDGHLEAFFFFSGYNKDGYALLSLKNSKMIFYLWSYH